MAAKVVDIQGKPYGEDYGSYQEYVEKSYDKPYILQELEVRARDAKKYSPDWMSIKHRQHIPVFVYDEFQPNGKFNEVLKGSPYLGRGVSSLPSWIMDEGPDGSPLCYRANLNHIHAARIAGHVYLVNPKILLSLDFLYENGLKMKREYKPVVLQDQSYRTKSGNKRPILQKVWTYSRIADFWRGVHMVQLNPVMNNAGQSVYEYKCKRPSTFDELYNHLDDHKALPTLFNQAEAAKKKKSMPF